MKGPAKSSLGWCVAFALGVSLLPCGCRRSPPRPEPTSAAATSASATASAPALASTPAAASAQPQSNAEPEVPAAPCRIISLEGRVQATGQPVTRMAQLDGKTWLSLDRGANVTIKHSSSAREYRLLGPGQALPCRDGLEEVLLTQGSFESAPGPGARPGALVLVATPAGSLSYGDGQLKLSLSGQGADISVISGGGWVEQPSGVRTELRAGAKPLHLPHAPRSTAQLVQRCEQLATLAREKAAELLDTATPRVELGKLAAAQVEQRQRARTACALAAASAADVKDDAARRRWEAAISHADAVWHQVPLKR